MADGFGQLHRPLRRAQVALANFHLAQFLACGTGLGLVEQLGLFEGEILHDVAADGSSDLASGVFNAGERGQFPSEV